MRRRRPEKRKILPDPLFNNLSIAKFINYILDSGKKGVSEKIVKILRKVVTNEEGTAGLANVNGYEIAGKTGTAEQVIDGQYSKTKINTFVSVFPSSNPKFVFIVMLDSPRGSKTYVYNYRNKDGSFIGTPFNTAGWTSVEVAGQIIEKIGPILATKYLQVY